MEKKYSKSLTSSEWGEIYNSSQIQQIVTNIKDENLSFQSKEMLKLTKSEESVLEIGCGSGATSAYLAMNGRRVTALDFSENALACTKGVAQQLGVDVKTIYADATKELPFDESSFDVIFQAGLLEHFERETRVSLLRNWGKYGNIMVSIIPNAASIAYRTGKAIMEKNNTWQYGMELPQYSLKMEFSEAGFEVYKEYTIGAEHALHFLPPRHYLRKALTRWLKEHETEDNCGQGYLLVTVGRKK